MAREKLKGRRISVWNWLGTLLLMLIPGVNIVALILFLIFSKVQAKRSFCTACLILIAAFIVLLCAVIFIFPDQLTTFAAWLREAAVTMP